MTTIISRSAYDQFSFDLMHQLVDTIDCEAYYIGSTLHDILQKFSDDYQFQKSTVVIGIKDCIDYDEFDFWKQTTQLGSQRISRMAQQHPNRRFVIFSSMENLQREIAEPNITIIPWGGDLTNQFDSYMDLDPVLDKNFSSDQIFLCLNRHTRTHRVVLLSYLFGNKLDSHGRISFLNSVDPTCKPMANDFLDQVNWEFDPGRHDQARSKMISGYQKIRQNPDLAQDSYEIYPRPQDNLYNFTNKLQKHYQNTFVEIIAETNFSGPAYQLTEKTFHCFFGCNFPILLSGMGAVQHLREAGFDMYDDVVCHDYDSMINPVDRLTAAVDLNRQLLTDSELVRSQWQRCRPRFEQNIVVAKNLQKHYRQRAEQLWNQQVLA